VSDSKSLDLELAAPRLPPNLAPFLSAVAAAGQDHEPFAVQLLSRSELIALEGCGLIERGPIARSAVGDTGYSLTRRGWEVVALLWYDRGPAARASAPVIRAG
jgi:hypothetical protein